MSARRRVIRAVSRAKSEYRYRVTLLATVSLFVNIAYAAYHGFLGITRQSVWFLAMWAYYMILGAVRFSAVLCEYKNSAKPSLSMEYFVMRVSGALLLVLGVVLTGVIYISLSQNIAARHDTITMIAIATYTFTKITFAIIKAVKRRGPSSPLLTAIKNIGFAEVAASVFTLQRSMVASFGEMERGYILDILTGAGICLFVTMLGIMMMVHGKRGERNGKIEAGKDE